MNYRLLTITIVSAVLWILYIEPISAQYLNIEELDGPYGGSIWQITKNLNNELFALTIDGKIYKKKASDKYWNNISSNSPSNKSSICINSKGHIFLVTGDKGIWRSIDNGASWNLLESNISKYSLTAIKIDAKDRIFVGTQSNGIYISKDNGERWEMAVSVKYIYYNTIEIADSNKIIIGLNNPDRLAITKDNGQSWNLAGDSALMASNIFSVKSYNNNIYVCTESKGIFRSTDFGETWKAINNGLPELWVTRVEPDKNGGIYAGCGNRGIYFSSDNGESWIKKSDSLTICSSFISDDKIYFGTSRDGIISSSDDGVSWQKENEGIKNYNFSAINYDKWGRLFVGTTNGKLFMADSGIWTDKSKGLPNIAVYTTYTYSKDVLLLGTSDGIFKSSNSGNSWEFIAGNYPLFSALLYFSENEKIYCSSLGKIYFSIDHGISWNLYSESLGHSYVNDLKMDNSTNLIANVLYEGLLYSSDKGLTWKNITKPQTYKTILAYNISAKGYIYAATYQSGMIYSKDLDQTWNSIPAGYYSITIKTLFIDSKENLYVGYSDGTIAKTSDYGKTWSIEYAGTIKSQIKGFEEISDTVFVISKADGVFKILPPTVTKVSANKDYDNYQLCQNYPNPFNPETKISYSIKEKSRVTLSVYDMLGRLVETLVNEEKAPGEYAASWRPINKSSGIYYYQIIAGDFNSIRKMVLMK